METNPATVVLFMQRCVHLLAVSRSVMMSSIGTENENVIGCKAKHKCLKERETGNQIYSIKCFIEKCPKYTHFVVSYKHLVYTPKGTEKVKSLETYRVINFYYLVKNNHCDWQTTAKTNHQPRQDPHGIIRRKLINHSSWNWNIWIMLQGRQCYAIFSHTLKLKLVLADMEGPHWNHSHIPCFEGFKNTTHMINITHLEFISFKLSAFSIQIRTSQFKMKFKSELNFSL